MRWKTNVEFKPYHGQQRVITKFAILPIETKDGEVRWLEKVTINQTYKIDPVGYWVNDCFLDIETKIVFKGDKKC